MTGTVGMSVVNRKMELEAGALSFLFVNTRVRQGCFLSPSISNIDMEWVIGRVVNQSHCGASIAITRVTGFVFADETLQEETKSLVLHSPELSQQEFVVLYIPVKQQKRLASSSRLCYLSYFIAGRYSPLK